MWEAYRHRLNVFTRWAKPPVCIDFVGFWTGLRFAGGLAEYGGGGRGILRCVREARASVPTA